MENDITAEDRRHITDGISKKYVQVAQSPEGQFRYPTGKKGLESLNYARHLIDQLPEAVAAAFCGVGNPFALGEINAGDQILDVGCGAGVDTILAGIQAGPTGSALGIDIVPQMLQRAEANLKQTRLENVMFKVASGEHLPFPRDAFDVVISNGVINLIPDKEAALNEIFRVLKPGGRLMVADQAASVRTEKNLKTRLANWFQ